MLRRTIISADRGVSIPLNRALQSVTSPTGEASETRMLKDATRIISGLDISKAETLGASFRLPSKFDPNKLRIDMWVSIDFDHDMEGKTLSEGSLAGDVYGLSMTNPVGGGQAYIRAGTGSLGTSNIVSIHPPGTYAAFYAKEGAIDVVFDRVTDCVSIDAYPTNTSQCAETLTYCPSRPYLEAYDENGKFLVKALYPGKIPWGFISGDGWQTIKITRPTRDIKRVRFSCQQCGCTVPNKGFFDNFGYHFQLP